VNDDTSAPSARDHGPKLISDLEDAIDRDVQDWDYHEEAKLAGQVVDVDEITTKFGPAPTANVLRKDGIELQVKGFGAVLKRFLATVEVGDLVAIRFIGMKMPQSGQNEYADFRTIVKNPDGSPKSRKRKLAAADASSSPELVVEPAEDEPW
jgi:hypothetical protein